MLLVGNQYGFKEVFSFLRHKIYGELHAKIISYSRIGAIGSYQKKIAVMGPLLNRGAEIANR